MTVLAYLMNRVNPNAKLAGSKPNSGTALLEKHKETKIIILSDIDGLRFLNSIVAAASHTKF